MYWGPPIIIIITAIQVLIVPCQILATVLTWLGSVSTPPPPNKFKLALIAHIYMN